MYFNIDDPQAYANQFADGPTDQDTVAFNRRSGRPFRFAGSKKVLLAYALLSLILGIISLIACVAGFILLPFYQPRQSFQIENKWTILSLILAGLSGLGLLYVQRLAFLCGALSLSLVSICTSFATMVVHAVLAHLKYADSKTYLDLPIPDKEKHSAYAISASHINIILAVLGALACPVSFLLHRYIVQTSYRNFGYTHAVEKHRFRLAMMGLAELIMGLLITGWWVGVHIFFSSDNLSHYALTTGEVFGHGFVLACTGYIQMLATSRGSVVLILCAAIFNGATVTLATYYAAYPLSLLYLVLDFSQATFSATADAKVALCALLCLVYILLITFSVYSFVQFLKILPMPNITTEILGARRRALIILSICFPILGIIFALLEIIAVTMHFMYKLDFTSLPIMVMVSGLLFYMGARFSSPLILSGCIAMLCMTNAHAIEELYLFVYHTSKAAIPDKNVRGFVDEQKMRAGNLALHFLQALLALAILVVCLVVKVILSRTISSSIMLSHSPLETKRSRMSQMWSSMAQLLIALVIIILSFKLLVDEDLYIEDFGVRSITVGFIILCAGAFGLVSRKFPIMFLSAMMCNILVTVIIWQESDRLTHLVQKHASRILGYENVVNRLPKISAAVVTILNANTTVTASTAIPTTTDARHDEWRQIGTLEKNMPFALACIVLLLLFLSYLIGNFYAFVCGAFIEKIRFTRSDTMPYSVAAEQTMIRVLNNGLPDQHHRHEEEMIDIGDSDLAPLKLELKPEVLVEENGPTSELPQLVQVP